ncbi:homoserine dehydrogenase [Paenibacillus hexagrammi]|uniref:Homoserine dehydrogenase n=1 Tax=Paenibacillus hexagrammi TaxID=2908839 RepID=A0ABY3SRH4_9BACL|nr:homoserine dehydrogenase [Paenibacillus sp. YPD9-1]UJF35710.1 homoserine dehydrogenase [Paenibacillus sp. YPD9-1]
MRVNLVLTGFGVVGREFVRLLQEKHRFLRRAYELDFRLVAVGGRGGFITSEDGLDLKILGDAEPGSDSLETFSKNSGLPLMSTFDQADALIEATPTDTDSGEPGFGYIMKAIHHQMDIVAISKGALVRHYDTIFTAADANQVKLKFSGATAAALPTLDIGQISLAGSEIVSIEGILNGTSNYILSSMQREQVSFEEALKAAQHQGIAEANPRLDVEGIDSACKILLLANSLLGSRLSLSDVTVTGIVGVSSEDIIEASAQGKKMKLLARAYKQDGTVRVEVGPSMIGSDHLLSSVDGTNKGIVFRTDTMGDVGAVGGSSSPRGAAAAALKDLIHLYHTT